MTKLKIFLSVLLALVLVLLGGVLPQLLLGAADRLSMNKLGTQPLQPLELQMKQHENQGPLSTPDQLMLLRSEGQMVRVVEDSMQSSRSTVEEKALEYVRRLEEQCGLLLPEEDPVMNGSPCMIFDIEGVQFDLFWQVALNFYMDDTGLDLQIVCLMDDCRNRVIQFEIESYGNRSALSGEPEQLMQISQFYVEALGAEMKLTGGSDYLASYSFSERPELRLDIYYYEGDYNITGIKMFPYC